jgi:hypothetical protein
LELSFSTLELRDICERREVAVATLGIPAALELEQRLADIEACNTVADLMSLFPDDIIDRSPDERSFLLTTGHAVVFRSGHVKTPTTSAGATDWERVTRIRIIALEIGDD